MGIEHQERSGLDMCRDITVITICFNSGETIRRTFNSVLRQTSLPKEYVVVDGGSTDATVSIIQAYEKLFTDSGVDFKWVSEKDNGLYDAMNKGVRMASGMWAHFLNSDDYYVNEYVLETVKPYLLRTEAAVVYGRTICIHDRIHSVMPDIKEDKLRLNMLLGCPVQQPASFYRVSLFVEERYRFDTSYKISADYKLFVELIQAQVGFLFMPVFVTCFSETGISSVHREDLAREEDLRLLRERGVSTLLIRSKGCRPLYKSILLCIQMLSKL